MKKVNKKQRLREFIDSQPRGVITRLAEHVGVSTVSVHGWLAENEGWMTRNNEKKVEEFIKQEQEFVQSALVVKEEPQQQLIEDFARAMLEVFQRYAPQLHNPGVVGEMDLPDAQRIRPKTR